MGFVEKSHRNGGWENPRGYVAHQVVLHHRDRLARMGECGGCFYHMRAAILLEDDLRREVYTRVITAGGGTVLENCSLEAMAGGKMEEVTHVFVEPGIVKETDPRHKVFCQWRTRSGEEGRPWVLHYKFLVYLVRLPIEGLTEKDYSVFERRIQVMAEKE